MAAAFEEFERVFVIGQPEQRRAAGAQQGDRVGRVESGLPGLLPFDIVTDAIAPPGRGVAVVVIERRAAIGERRSGHGASVGRRGRFVQ